MTLRIFVLCLIAAAACASAPPSKKIASATSVPPFSQVGTAVFYSAKFDGRRTASGERLDNSKLTAAHRTLPFGTRVRVTNLDNKKSIVVRINDRGPFRCRHIIDLSIAAARAIGLGRKGVARIKLELVR